MMDNLRDYITTIETGKRPAGGAESSGVPSLSAEHMDKDGHLHFGSSKMKYVSEDYYETLKTGKLRDGDIVLVKDGATTGKVAFVDEVPVDKACINEHCFILRANENLLNEYLFFYLFSPIGNARVLDSYKGATIGGIGKSFIDMPIRVPSLEKQKQIVSILRKQRHIIALYNRQLESLDSLIKSRFVEVFGDMADPKCKWNKCKLVEVCKDSDDIKCGPFGTQLGKDEYTSSGVAVWEIPQINSNFETHPTHFVTAEKANTLASYSIQPGDIAMSRKGNVGRCAVFPHEFENGIIHSDVLRIRVDDSKIDPDFLMRQLHYSGDIERQIELVSSGAIMAGINVTKLKNIFVFVPPKALQKVFVAFVHEVNKSKLAQVIYLR